jgi:hypothetical protein
VNKKLKWGWKDTLGKDPCGTDNCKGLVYRIYNACHKYQRKEKNKNENIPTDE